MIQRCPQCGIELSPPAESFCPNCRKEIGVEGEIVATVKPSAPQFAVYSKDRLPNPLADPLLALGRVVGVFLLLWMGAAAALTLLAGSNTHQYSTDARLWGHLSRIMWGTVPLLASGWLIFPHLLVPMPSLVKAHESQRAGASSPPVAATGDATGPMTGGNREDSSAVRAPAAGAEDGPARLARLAKAQAAKRRRWKRKASRGDRGS